MRRKRRYTILGWLAWQIGSRAARRKLAKSRLKLAAVAVATLALVAGGVSALHRGD